MKLFTAHFEFEYNKIMYKKRGFYEMQHFFHISKEFFSGEDFNKKNEIKISNNQTQA